MNNWLICVVVALLVQRPARAAIETPFAATHGAFFALSVADLDASVKWYSEKLGLTVVMRSPKQDDASAVVLEGGGLTVELVKHDDAIAPLKEPPLMHGFMKAGLVVDDLDKTLANLKARGVPIFLGPFPARGTIKSNAIIKDNAGNLLQFFGK
jgi:catechol 2,3-dioxygenase-like lactoylglutathione lyase family enzyme